MILLREPCAFRSPAACAGAKGRPFWAGSVWIILYLYYILTFENVKRDLAGYAAFSGGRPGKCPFAARLQPQVKAHVGGNAAVGNRKETLLAALTVCLPYIGFPRTLNALACINEVLPEKA